MVQCVDKRSRIRPQFIAENKQREAMRLFAQHGDGSADRKRSAPQRRARRMSRHHEFRPAQAIAVPIDLRLHAQPRMMLESPTVTACGAAAINAFAIGCIDPCSRAAAMRRHSAHPYRRALR